MQPAARRPKAEKKQLAKIERIEAPTADLRGLQFQFQPAPRSGREVVTIADMTHTYGDKILFLGASLEVERGDRIAFVGPNGAGKSTLLRLITGSEKSRRRHRATGRTQCVARIL